MTNAFHTPALNTVRVANPADYDGQVLVETLEYRSYRDEPTWAVPAWEERGLAGLCGPFASVEAAQQRLNDDREYVSFLGYKL